MSNEDRIQILRVELAHVNEKLRSWENIRAAVLKAIAKIEQQQDDRQLALPGVK